MIHLLSGALWIMAVLSCHVSMVPPPTKTVTVRKLPIYAALGVPEVWRFDVNTGTLWFGKLQPDSTYTAIERSESLPMLTPTLVLEALNLAEGASETCWFQKLRDWVRDVVR